MSRPEKLNSWNMLPTEHAQNDVGVAQIVAAAVAAEREACARIVEQYRLIEAPDIVAAKIRGRGAVGVDTPEIIFE